MRKIYQYFLLLSLALPLASCDSEFDDDLVRDSQPDVPVTFTGATTNGFNPYYTVSITGNKVLSLTLAIPVETGRTFKSLKKVTAGSTALLPGSLYDDTVKPIAADVPVTGTSVVFSMTFDEYNAKLTANGDKTPATVAAGALVERQFLFRIVLDDDSEIVAVPCRIRFTP